MWRVAEWWMVLYWAPPAHASLAHHLWSHLLVAAALGPQVLGLLLLGGFLFTRELHLAYVVAGLGASTVLNALLKRFFKEPRPLAAPRGGYGMPSDHAQFMFFLATYVVLMMLFRPRRSLRPLHLVERLGYALFMVAAAVLVAFSRVEMHYHTWQQVTVGGVVGSLLALFWFPLGRFLIRPYIIPVVVKFPGISYFCLRDSYSMTDILEIQWNQLYEKKELLEHPPPKESQFMKDQVDERTTETPFSTEQSVDHENDSE